MRSSPGAGPLSLYDKVLREQLAETEIVIKFHMENSDTFSSQRSRHRKVSSPLLNVSAVDGAIPFHERKVGECDPPGCEEMLGAEAVGYPTVK
jgi:hypothetical protein